MGVAPLTRFDERAFPSCMQSKSLLILKRTHGGQRPEMVVQCGDAQPSDFPTWSGAIPEISQKMLIQQLRDLEEDRIVSRTVYPQVPPKVEYCLTEIGKGLRARLRCSSRLGRIAAVRNLRARKLVSTKAEFNVEVTFSAFLQSQRN